MTREPRSRAPARPQVVTRRCDTCNENFLLPREFVGAHTEWTCIPCLDKASAEFTKLFLKETSE